MKPIGMPSVRAAAWLAASLVLQGPAAAQTDMGVAVSTGSPLTSTQPETNAPVSVSPAPRRATAAPGSFAADRAVPAATSGVHAEPVSGPRAPGSALDLGTTSITGHQELPKVLYIVPWKRSDLPGLVGRPVNTLLDEVLAPIDPDVFERHVDYYGLLYNDPADRAALEPRNAETEE